MAVRHFLLALPLLALMSAMPIGAHADWKSFLQDLKQNLSGKGTASSPDSAAIGEKEIAAGLREALLVAANRATERLGKTNGFLDHPQLRIPMPESLGKVEKLLRTLKQDQLADEFIATMNHAAERAVSDGLDIFTTAIRDMSWQDATDILKGPNDAATSYFQTRTRAPLTERMLPIVKTATETTGVTRTYKRVIDKADFVTRYMKPEEVDLDSYVTQRALDGLFHELALEEQRIRENPVARTSELLRKVFGQ